MELAVSLAYVLLEKVAYGPFKIDGVDESMNAG